MPQRQINLLRNLFAIYAAAAFIAGVRFLVVGDIFVGPLLIIIGSVLAPVCLSRSLDLAFLRNVLVWNIGGLFCLGVVLNIHQARNTQYIAKGVLVLAFVGMAIAAGVSPEPPAVVNTLFGTPKPAENLRSVYEEQIRAAAGQEERNRLARDLHDSIKQQIFAIQTTAAAAQARFDTDPTGARAAIESVRSSAREAMAEMEAMLDQLRAAPLESVGLVEALRKQCEALQFRTGAVVTLDVGEMPAPDKLPPGAAQSILRIAQEALANVARHARATEVKVSLNTSEGNCVLKVKDNGSGFVPGEASQTGMGLSNMRARAAEQGGKLTINSNPREGTRLLATIPLTRPEDEEAIDKARKASLLAGITILCGLLSVVFVNRFFEGLTLGFFGYSISMFVRWGHAADKGIRTGWLLTGLALSAGLLAYLIHDHRFFSALRGFSMGLFISAAVQFFIRSRA